MIKRLIRRSLERQCHFHVDYRNEFLSVGAEHVLHLVARRQAQLLPSGSESSV